VNDDAGNEEFIATLSEAAKQARAEQAAQIKDESDRDARLIDALRRSRSQTE
jgi:hypothetical protein